MPLLEPMPGGTELNMPAQAVPQFLQNWSLTRVRFGTDRVKREAKYFRRVALVKELPQMVRDELCYRNARLTYWLNS
jgi:hypothetical protein